MKDYDWLLFDLDNTILDFTASSYISFNKSMDELGYSANKSHFQKFKQINMEVWEEMESGKIDHQELKVKRWFRLFDELKLSLDPSIANEVYFFHIKENPVFVQYAAEISEVCKDKFNLMIITNGLAEVQWPRLRKTGLVDYFEHIVISDELGYAKPHSAYFEHCHSLMDYHAKEKILVIGDTLSSDIKGGKEFGFDTCWYNHSNVLNESTKTDFEIKQMKELRDILLL